MREREEKKILKVTVLVVVAVLCMASGAFATQTVDYGWEDGGTMFGSAVSPNNGGIASNSNGQVHSGSSALLLTASSTTASYNYLGWIQNLQAGDQVTASFWVYDLTPSGSPSARIWAHYDDSPTDPLVSNGSASGNSAYSGASNWSQLSYTWTVASGHTGLMVESRMYSAAIGDTIYVDDMQIVAPNSATVALPTAVPEPGSLLALTAGLIGLFGFVSRMRRD